LKRQRELVGFAFREIQTKLVQEYGALAGQVAKLNEIQAALPADTALVAWVDITPAGPNAADPDGEHRGVVVRSRGVPSWVSLAGTGPDGLWTKADDELPGQVRTAVQARPGASSVDIRPLLEKLRSQRLEPLSKALGATADALPAARRLIVLPSHALAGIPLELLLGPADMLTVSYVPSATVFIYLREQPRPDRRAGLLALGDPVGPAPMPGKQHEVEALAQLFKTDDRPARALLGADASEPELDRLAASGELGRFGFIHLAARGVVDESAPMRSALILTQTGLPDPLDQILNHKPVFDGRISAGEILRSWDLKTELVTLSACEPLLSDAPGGEGFVGLTYAFLIAGARSVCLPLWKVDDKTTSLLMTRFYQNLLGKRPELSKPIPKAEALHEAKQWLRSLTAGQIEGEPALLSRGDARQPAKVEKTMPAGAATSPATESSGKRPYDHPHFWAAFVLVGDPD